MRPLWLLLLAVLLAACSENEESDIEKSPELQSLRENVLACYTDIETVTIQHTEHCVIVAETISSLSDHECYKLRTESCGDFFSARDNIHAIYQSAIISSLLKFGISEELEAAAETQGEFVMFNGVLLRELFDDCLNEEEAQLAENGLKRVTTMLMPTLAEGQMCIREGYPQFEVEKLG